MSTILLATLGGQPQLITFALDALIEMGEDVTEVVVLYLSREGSRVNQALEKLSLEFVGDHYAHLNKPCRLRAIPLRDGLTRLTDIQTDQHAIATSDTLLELMTDLRKQRQPLHLFVAGGRRMMALLLVPIAQLHFGHEDKLWHIYTPDEFQEAARGGAIMHAPPEAGVRLIRVPLLPLGVQFPALRELATLTDLPKREAMSQADKAMCQAVWDNLTDRPRQVLRLLATGSTPQEVASQLAISLKTVSSHQTLIFDECRNAWGLPAKPRLDYHFLREKFGLFFG